MKRKAREMLEEDETPHLEKPLVRKKGGNWEDLPAKRSTSSVNYDPKVLKKITGDSEFSRIHTHPRLETDTNVEDPTTLLLDENDKSLRVLYPEIYKPLIEKGMEGLRKSDSLYSTPDILGLLKYHKVFAFTSH